MSRVVQLANIIAKSGSSEQIWTTLCEKLAEYQIGHVVYAYTRYRTAHGLGDPQDLVFYSNIPKKILEGLVLDGEQINDNPFVQYSLDHSGPISWGTLDDVLVLSDRHRELFNLARKIGLGVGYSMAFRADGPRSAGGIGLIAKFGVTQDALDAVWAEHGEDIQLLCTVAHLRLVALPQLTGRHLTPRQREVLEWVGEGKTIQDIATIMQVSPATVEKHMRLAREALDVETTAQAVLKAAFLNQVFTIEPYDELA